MEKELTAAFAGGLILGVGANLIADGISDHAKEQGADSRHTILLGLLLAGVYVLVVAYNRLKG